MTNEAIGSLIQKAEHLRAITESYDHVKAITKHIEDWRDILYVRHYYRKFNPPPSAGRKTFR